MLPWAVPDQVELRRLFHLHLDGRKHWIRNINLLLFCIILVHMPDGLPVPLCPGLARDEIRPQKYHREFRSMP